MSIVALILAECFFEGTVSDVSRRFCKQKHGGRMWCSAFTADNELNRSDTFPKLGYTVLTTL
jgi:hypothetical protein